MLKNILEIWETIIQNTLHNFTYNYIAFKKNGLPDITGDLSLHMSNYSIHL